jgi:hypothetical protein
MLLNTTANFIASAIFSGTFVITPLLIIVHFFKIRLYKIDKQVLVQAVDTSLLLGSTIFLLSLFTEFFIAYYSQVDYQQYAFVNRYTGPYWYLELVEIVCKLLLPQMLWYNKFRGSIGALIVIFVLWIIFNMISISVTLFTSPSLIPSSQSTGTWVNYRLSYSWHDLLIYIVLLTAVYFVLKRKLRVSAP